MVLQSCDPVSTGVHMPSVNDRREPEGSKTLPDDDDVPTQEGYTPKAIKQAQTASKKGVASQGVLRKKAICAGCGCAVFHTALRDHRKSCYRLHLYFGNCYRVLNVSL